MSGMDEAEAASLERIDSVRQGVGRSCHQFTCSSIARMKESRPLRFGPSGRSGYLLWPGLLRGIGEEHHLQRMENNQQIE